MKSSLVVVATFLFGCIVTTEAGAPCRNPPIMMRPDECCDFPKMGNEKEVVEACMVQHGAHVARLMADKNGSSYRGSCFAECIFNATGHTDMDKLGEEKLKEAEANGVAPEWIAIIKATAEECKEEAMNHAEDFEAALKLPPLDPADKVCHPKFGFALMCSMKNMMANCPDKFFKESPECKQMQEFSKTCDL